MTVNFLRVLLILGVLSICSASVLQNSKLLNVIQVYRHGERTPTSFYANDPYQDSSFWGGLSEGQLTNVGKRQHNALGQYTRKRYWDFLPLRYSREDFLVQSTNMDRTFMSAASQLSGLFPPVGDQVWNPLILWQPIPIFPTEVAVMSPMSTCTNFYLKLVNVFSDPYFVNLNKQYSDVFEYIANHSGNSVSSLFDAYSIYDTLYIEDRQNFPLPEWTKAVYPEPLKTLTNIVFQSFSYTDELKLFNTGPFFNQLIEQFDAYLEDPTSVHKYWQFSAHDTNIASILNTLGAFDPILAPNFASTIYIEFRERNGENFINIYYKNYGDAEPITVAGCDFDCEWNTFKSLISNRTLTPEEWYELCG